MDVAHTVYSRELKMAALRAMDAGETGAQVARRLQLSPKLLERWRAEWRAKGESAFPGCGRRRLQVVPDEHQDVSELERKIGQLTVENDFLKKALTHFREHHPPRRQWRSCLYQQVQEAAQAGGPVKSLCAAANLSRPSYYRSLRTAEPEAKTLELRDQIQKIALQFPAYGYRRITAELRRRGYAANHKRVLRLMRQDNLLCLRRKSFLRTTDAAHPFPVFPNLAATLVATAVNQLWVADLTYIRLRSEFVYLAVILDAYSRRVVGWALGRTLEAELALTALRMGIAQRRPAPGLVHHSDRGVQYACSAYTALLTQYGIRGSMSRTGNPYDNAYAESFMKTLKYEEVYRNEYIDLAEAAASIGEFIDQVYNRQRLHSALGYRPPVEFEQTDGFAQSARERRA